MSEQVEEPVESEPDEPRVDEDGGAAVDDPGGSARADAEGPSGAARGGAERSADDTDTGWGEAVDAEQQDREHWLRGERPPHWG